MASSTITCAMTNERLLVSSWRSTQSELASSPKLVRSRFQCVGPTVSSISGRSYWLRWSCTGDERVRRRLASRMAMQQHQTLQARKVPMLRCYSKVIVQGDFMKAVFVSSEIRAVKASKTGARPGTNSNELGFLCRV